MNTSAMATTVNRRSLLPAPKNVGARASVGASKSAEVVSRKSKETTSALTSGVQVPTSLNVDASSTTVAGRGNESEGKLAGNLLGTTSSKCSSGTESRQTQLLKLSSLRQPAVAGKRPSSASSVLSRAGQELNRSSAVSKISRDSGSSAKPTAVKGTATSANDQNAQKKQSRMFRSVSSSQYSSISTNQERSDRSVDATARKLKLPTKFVVDDDQAVTCNLPETASKIVSRSEFMLNAEPVIQTELTTKTRVREDATACVLPECASVSSAECRSGTVVREEIDPLESLSGTIGVTGVPDVLSQVTNDDSEHLASSSGSLGILDDAELLDTSLLSLDHSSAASSARASEVAICCNQTENPPYEKTLQAVELCFNQSPSEPETDPQVQFPTTESSVQLLRPLSLMSNSSADAGIVADCVGLMNESPQCPQERPSSYMSTSSADTGM